jgi:EAL domain-containing protein (putative c-di-GMP-specific phosphodiesterase class I)
VDLIPAPPLRAFTHAFQPIVDVSARAVWAYEALLRGPGNESAGAVMADLDRDTLHRLDRGSRVSAIALASRLGMTACLSLNAMPQSLDDADHRAGATVEQARACGFPLSRIIVELTENEAISDRERFTDTVAEYRALGVQLAIDDFGAGHSGLNLLADFQPDILKLDMGLVRNIGSNGPRQSIVRAIIQVCEDLAIDVVAEGVETVDEYAWFEGEGVRLFQGYLFARPGFESLPLAFFPGHVLRA